MFFKSVLALVLCISMLFPTELLQAAAPVSFSAAGVPSSAANLSRDNKTQEKVSEIPRTTEIQSEGTTEQEPEIKTFRNQFVRGADKNEDGGNVQYIWNANTNEPGHRFVFRVNYDISGIKERPAGNIKITIPRQILKDRTGNFADAFEMSLPELQKDPETGDYYPMEEQAAYFEVGIDYGYYLSKEDESENIIVTNLREVPAAQNGYFEVSYGTIKETWEYPDMGENLAFTSKIQAGESEPIVENPISVAINTGVCIISTEKRYPTLYREWDHSWGEEPSDADDYYYLVWEIASRVENGTQPYTFTLEDTNTDIKGSVEGGTVEVVGYKFSGESVFSNKNTAENQISSAYGYRFDYVLTRHDKAHYGETVVDQYEITNTEKATVTPFDKKDEPTSAISTKVFLWENPYFERPNGHFYSLKYGNNNWHLAYAHPYHWDYASYNLDQFQEKSITSIDTFRYDVWGYGYPYPWTIGDNMDKDDPNAYGHKKVTYELIDNTLYFEEDVTEEDGQAVVAEGATPISRGDYELLKLDPLQVTTKRYRYDDTSNKFVYDTNEFETTDILKIYGELYNEVKSEKEWVLVGTLNLGTGKAETESGENGVYLTSFSSSAVVFNAEAYDFTGYKLETSNAYYYTSLRAYPTFRLKDSELIMKRTKTAEGNNKDVVRLANLSGFHVYDSKGKEIYEQTRAAIDRVIRSQKDSELKKEVVSSGNDVQKKRYTIRWKITQKETVTTGTGTKDFVRQDAGTFYDLLPNGAVLEKGSLYVTGENGRIDDSYIDYQQIPNYRDSGRTMLIVHVNKQESYYTAFYNTVHTWDSLADWGVDVLNPIAYAKGNTETTEDGETIYTGIAGGSVDNGGDLSETNKELMSGLDSDSGNAERFLFEEKTYRIDALTAAMAGLKKQIKAEEESAYSYDSITKPEGNYSYQLRFQNTQITKAKDMIFFDSLENYVTPEGCDSDWKGTLTGIDVSQLEEKGIKPVCYISEVDNLNLEQENPDFEQENPELKQYKNLDLTDDKVWQEVTENTDLSRAKAVAIDMRKTEDGSDFILDSGDSVTAVLHMKAPKKVAETENDNHPVAFNNIYIEDTVLGNGGSEEHFFIHQDYTTIYYHITADLELQKISTADESVRVPEATYRISGRSDYGQKVEMIQTTNQDGILKFKDIEKGTYTLREISCSADWQLDTKEHKLVVDGLGDVYVDGKKVTNDKGTSLWTTEDEPRIHADLSFDKRNSENQYVNGAEFKLSGISDYGNEVTMYAESSGRGKVSFSDIELGTYELKETKAPEGYILDETIWRVHVDENGNVSIRDEKRDEIKKDTTNGTYFITNERRYHSFQLHKIDADNASFNLQGAEFTLTGVSELGTKVSMTVTSGEDGMVKFEHVEKGSYVLQETEAPFNYSTLHGSTGDRKENPTTEEGETIYRYDLDKTKYPVVIDSNGNVTIKGLEKDRFGFVVKNYRHTEKIRIIKKWVDMDDKDRKYPVIHVSQKNPTITGPTIIFDPNGGTIDGKQKQNPVFYDKDNFKIALGSYIEPKLENQTDGGTYVFDGWYLDQGCTEKFVMSETDSSIPDKNSTVWSSTEPVTVYAKYRKINIVNYVVSLYGIQADTLKGGATSGLTFGPATWGANGSSETWNEDIYNHGHMQGEVDGSGKRCIHNDSWAEIIKNSRENPSVYADCYGDSTHPSCTKVIEVVIPEDIRSDYQSAEWQTINHNGGYASMFYGCLKEDARKWNDTETPGVDWEHSKVRKTLNESLINGFPQELQGAIKEKQVSYYTYKDYEDIIASCDDKLWLLSQAEIYNSSDVLLSDESNVQTSGDSKNYQRFQMLGITGYDSENFRTKAYAEDWKTTGWWLRSIPYGMGLYITSDDGRGDFEESINNQRGLAPAFCLPGPSGTSN